MPEFDFRPSTENPLTAKARDLLPATVDRLRSFPRRAHEWARPAWRDLPALLTTLRDAGIVIASFVLTASATAAVAAIVTAISNLSSGGSPLGY